MTNNVTNADRKIGTSMGTEPPYGQPSRPGVSARVVVTATDAQPRSIVAGTDSSSAAQSDFSAEARCPSSQ